MARLVDCPGYGFANASVAEKERWRKFMEEYLRNSPSVHRSMLLLDLNTGILPADRLIMNTLVDTMKPFSVILTKVDKVKSKLV